MGSTCPYCNSEIGERAPGARRLCPRCGEPLPAVTATAVTATAVTATADDATAAAIPGRGIHPGATGHSNRAVARIVLGVMLALFLVGLGFALWTQGDREKNHPQSDGGAVATPKDPLLQPGLGYLPPETNLVAVLRGADLLAEETGKRLLASPRPRLIDLALSRVERWTGTPAANIDHLVVGTSVIRADRIPPLTLVVQTRHGYHPATVAKALGSKAITHRERPLFRFHFPPAGEGYLWCMNPRVMVLVLRVIEAVKIEDLDIIPREPWDGASKLPQPLREIIERMDRDSLAWVAGHVSDPAPVENIVNLLHKDAEPIALVAKVQAFGAWLVPEEKTLRLSGTLRGRDEEARAQAASLLKRMTLPGIELKMTQPPPEAPATERVWLQFQTRASPDRIRELLQR